MHSFRHIAVMRCLVAYAQACHHLYHGGLVEERVRTVFAALVVEFAEEAVGIARVALIPCHTKRGANGVDIL